LTGFLSRYIKIVRFENTVKFDLPPLPGAGSVEAGICCVYDNT